MKKEYMSAIIMEESLSKKELQLPSCRVIEIYNHYLEKDIAEEILIRSDPPAFALSGQFQKSVK